ncbi:MAG: hypothetical protein U1E25_15635 [Methylocystis sp.]
MQDLSSLQFKGDDSLAASFFAQTTSKIWHSASTARPIRWRPRNFPAGAAAGEPIRLFADIEEGADRRGYAACRAGVAAPALPMTGAASSSAPTIFCSSTRRGRAVLSVDAPSRLKIVSEAQGDHVAIIGENRKLLVFPLSEAPRMARGTGVRMQRYKDGGVSDAKVFPLKDGLTWTDASARVFTIDRAELKDWIGHRAEAGRLPPRGFPRNNRFG